MFINDVGQGTWEEINDGARRRELRLAGHRRPDHGSAVRLAALQLRAQRGGACAIAGGAFYTPADRAVSRPTTSTTISSPTTAPAGFAGSIRPTATRSARSPRGISSPVDLKVADDGSLYYLARGSGGAVLSDRVRRDRADDHDRSRRAGPSRPAHRSRSACARRARAAALSVAAQRREHRRRDLAGLHHRLGRHGRQRRALPRRRLATTTAARPAPRPC